ncbi:MAG: SDR family oxidoreductase [Candidatus Poribacteria bacterium]|nr:SDR family oxidoreductase [Candidatus Poribacteria bacterium]
MSELKLRGKIALVTGAGRGIGKATAKLLAKNGAEVVLTARTASEIDKVAENIVEDNGGALPISGDITNGSFVTNLFSQIQDQYGRLDILINNAGKAPFGTIEEMSVDVFRSCLELNVVAVFRCTQEAVKLMKAKNDEGKIINIGSVRSHWSEAGGDGAYNASKFALKGLTETVARQLHGTGSKICVGLICPGGVDTSLVNPSGEPNPRLLRPSRVAEAVLHAVTSPPDVNIYDITLFNMSQVPW